jgi:Predicted pyrophosphatase
MSDRSTVHGTDNRDTSGDLRVHHEAIVQFVDKHDLSVDGQFGCLVEEVGEFADCWTRKSEIGEAKEELGDVLFVAWTLCLMLGIDPQEAVNEVAHENLDKSTATEGQKVTKQRD